MVDEGAFDRVYGHVCECMSLTVSVHAREWFCLCVI